ncbi:positive regulation of deadenylation-independent decapping of nuclear-transcribed mRNA [Dimargaris xerosporica]|nr:positive regulation of deadenylation-independent decapping of nuclear-transcribed mRNA [Dimargaris xerosporica]
MALSHCAWPQGASSLAQRDWNDPTSLYFVMATRACASADVSIGAPKPMRVGRSERWGLSHSSPKPTRDSTTPPDEEVYKTELCRSFAITGHCKYANNCKFAHGLAELRPRKRHPKYKSIPCRTFEAHGCCPYGNRCNFIHAARSVPLATELGTVPVRARSAGELAAPGSGVVRRRTWTALLPLGHGYARQPPIDHRFAHWIWPDALGAVKVNPEAKHQWPVGLGSGEWWRDLSAVDTSPDWDSIASKAMDDEMH